MNITGGKYNSRVIKTAEFENIKPTLSKTRQGIFNTLSSMMDFEGKIFFDMFSGSGIMALEALSRGFKTICFEKDKKTLHYIELAYKSLGEKAQIYLGNSIINIQKINERADVIFIDPPYMSDLYEKSLFAIKEFNKLAPFGIIVIEHPTEKQIDIFDFVKIKEKIYGNKKITYLKKEII